MSITICYSLTRVADVISCVDGWSLQLLLKPGTVRQLSTFLTGAERMTHQTCVLFNFLHCDNDPLLRQQLFHGGNIVVHHEL